MLSLQRPSPRAARAALAATAALLGAGLYATGASAGCGGPPTVEPAAFRTGGDAPRFVKTAFAPFAPIVGMWSVTFIDSAGKLNDFGYQQWHSDGTEILNSGLHSPATQNFCLGAWRALGPRRFQLNHFALSFDPGATSPSLKINIKEEVEVDGSGDVYRGVFSQDVVSAATGASIAHITGKVTGQRIKADS